MKGETKCFLGCVTMGKKIVTAEELAEQLSLKPKTIHDWARQGKIPSLRISPKVIRFEMEAVLAVIKRTATGEEIPKCAS